MKRRLLAIIPSLRKGGAERVMAWLCNSLAERGEWQVFLLVYSDPDDGRSYEVADDVTVIHERVPGSGGDPRKLRALWMRIRCIQKNVVSTRADTVVSFLDTNNIIVLLASLGFRSGPRVVISERIDPRMQPVSLLAKVLRRLLYPRAEALVVQTNRIADYFQGWMPERLRVIPNAVDLKEFKPVSREPASAVIVSMGRLARQKGFRFLLGAFDSLRAEFRKWGVVIYGEGEERQHLEEIICEKGLGGRVEMPGAVDDVASVLRSGRIFAFPSRYEGFPNALAEAMACGLPVVAFQGVSGVDELVEDGATGFLVSYGSELEFRESLRVLMNDCELRREMGVAGRKRVEELCDPARILVLWEEALTDGES